MAEKKTTKDEPEGDSVPKGSDLGKAEVQERFDEEQKQGFAGVEVDPTPNQNYTLEGAAAGKPTPETDDKAAEKARKETGL